MIASNIASANNHEHPEPHGRSLFRFFLVLTTESSITQMLQEPRRHMRVCKGKAKGGEATSSRLCLFLGLDRCVTYFRNTPGKAIASAAAHPFHATASAPLKHYPPQALVIRRGCLGGVYINFCTAHWEILYTEKCISLPRRTVVILITELIDINQTCAGDRGIEGSLHLLPRCRLQYHACQYQNASAAYTLPDKQP